jgi:exosortase
LHWLDLLRTAAKGAYIEGHGPVCNVQAKAVSPQWVNLDPFPSDRRVAVGGAGCVKLGPNILVTSSVTSFAAPRSVVAPVVSDAPRSAWTPQRLAAAGALLAGGLFAARGGWEDIFRIATRDEEASHIWLVPFLVGWLVHVRRKALVHVTPTSSLLGPVLVAIGWALCHWGFNAAKQSPLHAGALLVAVGSVVTILGPRLLITLWPAVLLMAFIVPVPGLVRQRISIPLEQVTARATSGILAIFGVPLERSANVITINGRPVTVAEACNGLRMIFPLLMIVYVFCFTLPLKASVRWLLLLTSPLSAVVCNVLRLLPTVLLYGYASKGTADIFHEYSGWPMVAIAFLALMLVIKTMRAMGWNVMQRGSDAATADQAVDRHIEGQMGHLFGGLAGASLARPFRRRRNDARSTT